MANMWCAHTDIDSAMIPMVAATMPRYPNNGFRLKTGMTSVMMPKNGNRHYVHLRMAEEPEQVLPQQRPAGVRVEDVSTQLPISQQRQQQRGKQGKHHEDHEARDQNVPGKDRHPEHGHARRPQGQHGGDHVDRAQDRAQTRHHQADDPQVGACAGRVRHAVEWCIGEPAEIRGSARGGKSGQDEPGAEEIEPVSKRVQAGKGDIRGADLQGHDVVREREQDGRREQQQHDCAVHGE